MDRHAESVQGVVPGLALWQFRGPSTRRTGPDGERVYLHLATPPYDEIIVRGMPVRRVRGASTLGDGKALPFTAYPYLKDVRVRTADPSGDVRVDLTNVDLDEAGTVIALDLADAPFS
jgi:alpha-L-fucosidase